MCLTAQGRLGLCDYIFLGYLLEYEGMVIVAYTFSLRHYKTKRKEKAL